jgi:Ca2+-binding RTX toxin-like protein
MAILTGNNEADRIVGTDALDVISGLGGADLLGGANGNDFVFGGEGNDFVEGDNGNDVVDGGNGNDFVAGDSGSDFLFGGAGNDFVSDFSVEGTNFLDGGLGDDILSVSGGNNTLTGNLGQDTFQIGFSNPLTVTRITDFSPIDDQIELQRFGFNGEGNQVLIEFNNGLFNFREQAVFLSPQQFAIGATATTAAQRIIYNQSTGAVFFDRDGIGSSSPVQILQLNAFLNLTNNDFLTNLAA